MSAPDSPPPIPIALEAPDGYHAKAIRYRNGVLASLRAHPDGQVSADGTSILAPAEARAFAQQLLAAAEQAEGHKG